MSISLSEFGGEEAQDPGEPAVPSTRQLQATYTQGCELDTTDASAAPALPH